MILQFCPLFSGSSGNALLVRGGDTYILIDSGMSGKQEIEALNSVGVDPSRLSAIVVTHEHSDHIKSVGIMSRKFDLPVYATEPTWNMMARSVGNIRKENIRPFDVTDELYIGDLCVRPFAIPHDAACPVGYHVFCGGLSIATATDMGHMTPSVFDEIRSADLVLLESNHDPDMLMHNEHYSAALKRRILGNKGHLSNEACAEALVRLCDNGLQRAILGHLSGENNTPELAMNTSVNALCERGAVLGTEINVDMAWRDHPGHVYTLED